MKLLPYWIPAAFCAFLSIMALVGVSSSPEVSWWKPAFYAFLPMCFFFVGSVMAQMDRQIRALREQVDALKKATVD